MADHLGLFQWIRNGVRQSVLLGVSDALESIGTPDDAGKIHPVLLSFHNASVGSSGIGQAIDMENKSVPRNQLGNSNPRKRLGRSLKDIEQPKPAS